MDDNYGDSSSDSSWRHNLHVDIDEELDDDRAVDAYSEDSNTNFSDFEDNEALVVVPDSDNEAENDLMRQVMRQKYGFTITKMR